MKTHKDAWRGFTGRIAHHASKTHGRNKELRRLGLLRRCAAGDLAGAGGAGQQSGRKK